MSFDAGHKDVRRAIDAALAEDLGAGDLTTDACIPAEMRAEARFVARQDLTVAGVELLDVLQKLEQLEIVEAVTANAAGLIVERDDQDPNRLNAKIPADVVNGLHVFAGRIDLLL